MAQFPIRECPLCDYSTKMTTKLEKHLIESHDREPLGVYLEAFYDGKHPLCACGCGIQIIWKGWKAGLAAYIRGHNASDASQETKKKRKETLKKNIESGGVTNWAKGLTKETDTRISIAAKKRSITAKEQFDNGRSQWNEGLTKETDERVRAAANDLRCMFASKKLIPWSKGLTKHEDIRLFRMGRNISDSLQKNKELRDRLAQQRRLTNDEITKRIIEQAPSFTPLFDFGEYVNSMVRNLKFQCKTCGTIKTRSLNSLGDGCLVCNKPSKQQQELLDFVSTLGFNATTTRDVIQPYELDIYIPTMNFAIEYNGLWWHCERENREDHQKHSRKTMLCDLKGIKLLHVFSDEWKTKKPIVKSMIKARLGCLNRTIGARKCKIVDVKSHDRKEFFEKTHIDGDVKVTRAWGLMYNDELVAALSVRQTFHKKWSSFLEIARFSTSCDTSVQGALGRLTSCAMKFALEQDRKGLITYVDTRHGDGHSYEKIGFIQDGMTSNRFWWTNCQERFNRFKYKADKKRGMTEKEVAAESNVWRIWGCPNKRYVKLI